MTGSSFLTELSRKACLSLPTGSVLHGAGRLLMIKGARCDAQTLSCCRCARGQTPSPCSSARSLFLFSSSAFLLSNGHVAILGERKFPKVIKQYNTFTFLFQRNPMLNDSILLKAHCTNSSYPIKSCGLFVPRFEVA